MIFYLISNLLWSEKVPVWYNCQGNLCKFQLFVGKCQPFKNKLMQITFCLLINHFNYMTMSSSNLLLTQFLLDDFNENKKLNLGHKLCSLLKTLWLRNAEHQ